MLFRSEGIFFMESLNSTHNVGDDTLTLMTAPFLMIGSSFHPYVSQSWSIDFINSRSYLRL